MRAKLKLVVSNTDVNDKIIASIRPLDRKVVPSERFLQKMKLRLLEMSSPPSGGGAQAA